MNLVSGQSVSLYLVAAAIMGFVGVAAGAFGAHAIRNRVPGERLAVFETGVRYLMYHALAMIGVAYVQSWQGADASAAIAGWCFILGSLVFSGSLVALALTGKKRWGAVTPIGGLLLLAGWVALAWAAVAAYQAVRVSF